MVNKGLNSWLYWNRGVDTVLQTFETNPNGLDEAEARKRLEIFGWNKLDEKSRLSAFSIFINQFKNPIMLILIGASIISALVKELSDSIIIFLIILGSSILSFIQELNANDSARKLEKQISIKSIVLRDKTDKEIESSRLVPGDIVRLSAGSLIPSDGLILESNHLFVNQSVLTGETFPVEKKSGVAEEFSSLPERSNCVFMGTNVRSGTGLMVVTRTGQSTEFGKIAKSLILKPTETEFERGVREFGFFLTTIMLIMVILVFGFNNLFKKPFLDSLLFSIALGVGITPQLLPAIVSITLSKGAQQMAKNGVIVKKLNSLENFGSMDVLCTDKTGTITEGKIKLEGCFQFDGKPSDEIREFAFYNAFFQMGIDNAIDQAILDDIKIPTEKIIKIAEIPYDFIRKRLSILIQRENETLLITKGALREILEVCKKIKTDNAIEVLGESHLKVINSLFKQWSKQGNRVLGLSVRNLNSAESISHESESEMIFLGFLVFYDPPKKDASLAIHNLQKLGIDLKIITGDNKNVSEFISKEIGLKNIKTLVGSQLNRLSDEALWNQVEKTNLFAEVDPNQKERIISALQKKGHIVGYMGDGINDAPSLHNADVGISIDQAVDVAKDAADFVLLRHSLDILVNGVQLGRITFANTMKYINITTSANFGNMLSMAGISVLLPFLPLLPMQVLLTNFLTDFPALMIAADSVDNEQIETPHRWSINSIKKFMIFFGSISSIFDYVTFGVLLYIIRAHEVMFRSGWFVESVITEIIALLILRTSKSFIRGNINRWLLLLSVIVLVVTVGLVYLPGVNALLGLTPLPIDALMILFTLTLFYLFLNEFAKKMFFTKTKNMELPL